MCKVKFEPLLDLCMSSLRGDHANLLGTVPILLDVPKGTHVLVKLYDIFLFLWFFSISLFDAH